MGANWSYDFKASNAPAPASRPAFSHAFERIEGIAIDVQGAKKSHQLFSLKSHGNSGLTASQPVI